MFCFCFWNIYYLFIYFYLCCLFPPNFLTLPGRTAWLFPVFVPKTKCIAWQIKEFLSHVFLILSSVWRTQIICPLKCFSALCQVYVNGQQTSTMENLQDMGKENVLFLVLIIGSDHIYCKGRQHHGDWKVACFFCVDKYLCQLSYSRAVNNLTWVHQKNMNVYVTARPAWAKWLRGSAQHWVQKPSNLQN